VEDAREIVRDLFNKNKGIEELLRDCIEVATRASDYNDRAVGKDIVEQIVKMSPTSIVVCADLTIICMEINTVCITQQFAN
jgi:hypothetical protein